MPYGLPFQPVSCDIFRDPGRSGKLLDCSDTLPIPPRAVVDILKPHYISQKIVCFFN